MVIHSPYRFTNLKAVLEDLVSQNVSNSDGFDSPPPLLPPPPPPSLFPPPPPIRESPQGEIGEQIDRQPLLDTRTLHCATDVKIYPFLEMSHFLVVNPICRLQ